MSDFTAQVFQNPYLPENGEHVNAVLTIQCNAVQNRPDPLTLGAIIDCSGSMGEGRRIQQAKKAVAALIEVLPEDAHFFVIAGNHESQLVVPSGPATPENKIMALSGLQTINATGGTAMSQWLHAARGQFRSSRPGIHRAVLLTDGKNDNSDPLDQVLAECAGQFQVDARG
ncbi:MAG: VWA domain-containing protein, partial [Verrucomicrobia bacterium]|nr:VWA domain-containing protein [Verrucomicrobiota bacterium]